MLVPACGSSCTREGASSKAEPARGSRGPSSEAEPARGGVSPRARRTSPEGGVSPRARRTSPEGGVSPRARRTCSRGRLVGPLWWATGAIAAWAVLCAYVLCYVQGVFAFCVFCRF
jgi:hypothetical protein